MPESSADVSPAVSGARPPRAVGDVVLAAEPLRHGLGNAATGGIWRVRGPAGSAILKVARLPAERDPVRGPFTAQAALADPANHIVNLEGAGDWTTHEVTAPIPDETNTVAFGVFLAGSGRIELRNPELTRAGLAYQLPE